MIFMTSRAHTVQSPSAESSNTQQEVEEEAAAILLSLRYQQEVEEAAAILLTLRRFDESPLPQDQISQAAEARGSSASLPWGHTAQQRSRSTNMTMREPPDLATDDNAHDNDGHQGSQADRSLLHLPPLQNLLPLQHPPQLQLPSIHSLHLPTLHHPSQLGARRQHQAQPSARYLLFGIWCLINTLCGLVSS